MNFLVSYIDRFYPSAIRFYGSRTVQKKHRRAMQGLLLPVRCPMCREYTRQRPAKAKGLRRCLSCGSQFTRGDSRRGVIGLLRDVTARRAA